MDTAPIKIGSASAFAQRVRAPQTVVPERNLDNIKIMANGQQKHVCNDYLMSVLIKYSGRARAEFKDVADTINPGDKVDWVIDFSAFHNVLEVDGLKTILRWLKTLPTGEVRGKPQVFNALPKTFGIYHHLRIYEAALELKLLDPITDQFLLRKAINNKIWDTPMTTTNIAMIWTLFEHADPVMANDACTATNQFNWAGRAPVGLDELRVAIPALALKLWAECLFGPASSNAA
ncbi:hypothetical protein EJ08DRAFT_655001 [Tothia fuscella]|uniref:Uncharacterized protein n=1 Tax=Tothia fuscella TaxID=1048955 RepID=A0A9P4P3T3_9PEZI|nr:hypothetical protein EJ08DRAFT_655001 [Tothia fuscella]